MVKGKIPTLNSDNFEIWVIYFVVGISKHLGAKHVLNMIIPEDKTDDQTNKQIVDF